MNKEWNHATQNIKVATYDNNDTLFKKTWYINSLLPPHHFVSSFAVASRLSTFQLFSKLSLSFLQPHLSADVFRLLRELIRIFLLVLPHSSVHLLTLDTFLALAERWLALDHLKDQTAQPPPVWTEGVALILDHLGCWNGKESWRVRKTDRQL